MNFESRDHHEIAGRRLGDVLALAMREGLDVFPYRSGREKNAEGEMVWVNRYRLPEAPFSQEAS